MKDQTLVEDRPATDDDITADETIETPTVTDTPVTEPAAAEQAVEAPTASRPRLAWLRGKRAMAGAAAAVLLLIGGGAGYAIGHATADTTPAGFEPGQLPNGGPMGEGGPGGQGGPGQGGGQMGQPPNLQDDSSGTTQDGTTGSTGSST